MKLRKVMVIGVGNVGTAAIYSLINRGFCDEIALADLRQDRIEADAKDFRDAAAFLPNACKISVRNSDDCKDMDIAIISVTAGIVTGKDRKEELSGSAKIIRSIVPPMMRNGFKGIFLIATNPCDAITYQAWKMSGLPRNQVIGTGVWLDTIRLRNILSEMLNIGPQSIDAYILGEHGNSQFPVWSHANIYGVSLEHFSSTPLNFSAIAEKVRNRAFEILPSKGCTEYGIGSTIAEICFQLFTNSHRIIALSCILDGEYGHKDVAIGVPAVLTQKGMDKIIEIDFTSYEQQLFTDSIDVIKNYVKLMNSAK